MEPQVVVGAVVAVGALAVVGIRGEAVVEVAVTSISSVVPSAFAAYLGNTKRQNCRRRGLRWKCSGCSASTSIGTLSRSHSLPMV